MSQELTPIQFIQKLQASIKEYKKQYNDTRSDHDAAHFFNTDLKRFIKSHKEELDILSSMNFEKGFVIWIKNYLLKEKEDE